MRHLAKVTLVLSLFCLLFVFCFGISASLVLAQETGLVITPPTFELSANRGDTLTNTLKVENAGDKPLEISVDKRLFVARGEEGSVELSGEKLTNTLAEWIQVSPVTAVIPPRSNQTFTIFIPVPDNAEPGGHFASVVFKTGGAGPNAQGASVVQEIGALILLRVAGEVKESWAIEEFSTTKELFERAPVDFVLRVSNAGNVHIKVKGSITITDVFGRVVDKFDLDQRNVLPQAIRRIETQWNKDRLFGRYVATISVAAGQKTELASASVTFFVLPYKLLAGIAVGALIVMIILVKIRKRLSKALKILFRGLDPTE